MRYEDLLIAREKYVKIELTGLKINRLCQAQCKERDRGQRGKVGRTTPWKWLTCRCRTSWENLKSREEWILLVAKSNNTWRLHGRLGFEIHHCSYQTEVFLKQENNWLQNILAYAQRDIRWSNHTVVCVPGLLKSMRRWFNLLQIPDT